MFNFFKILIILIFVTFKIWADEGMWTYNNFPITDLTNKYQFSPSQEWLDHARLSSVRLAGGCSGSYVSKNGLVMTNHHCARSCIDQISTSKMNFIKNGFLAKILQDEIRCPEIEINQLIEISDITDSIQAVTSKLSGKEFNDALKAIKSKIESNCSDDSKSIRCDVVSLYRGGQYNLYKYKRYQDVRLAFAPEEQIAAFGGDPDNFMFPRYCLDMSFLRVYENNKPIESKNYFKWSQQGAKENELTFVSGHPAQTSRLSTVSQLEYIRDFQMIKFLTYYSEYRGLLTEFQKRGNEQKRISQNELIEVENILKNLKGQEMALMDKSFFESKIEAERDFRREIDENPELKEKYGNAWDELAQSQIMRKEIFNNYYFMEGIFESSLYSIAKTIIRGRVEYEKPNEIRLKEFTDSRRSEVEQILFSSAPIFNELEIAKMTYSLTKMREILTPDHPFVQKVLGKKSPEELATYLIKNTQLNNVKFRKKLWSYDSKTLAESKDPMIQIALLIDPDARSLRKKYEEEIVSNITKNSEKLAKAMFIIYGPKKYPDATSSLRLSYGKVSGYEENGNSIYPFTTIEGVFLRNTGSEPFKLPPSWIKAKSNLNLRTPFNFITTNDIIGGNSGSPVFNKNLEIVGLIFDGNIHSLGGDFGFDESQNRAVAVHSESIIEALKNVYGAKNLVNEIQTE